MRSHAVLSVAFVAIAVAPVMSAPAPAADKAELFKWNSGVMPVNMTTWTPSPIPIPSAVASCQQGSTCKRVNSIWDDLIHALQSALLGRSIVTRDPANTLIKLPQSPEDALDFLGSLFDGIKSVNFTVTTTQSKRSFGGLLSSLGKAGWQDLADTIQSALNGDQQTKTKRWISLDELKWLKGWQELNTIQPALDGDQQTKTKRGMSLDEIKWLGEEGWQELTNTIQSALNGDQPTTSPTPAATPAKRGFTVDDIKSLVDAGHDDGFLTAMEAAALKGGLSFLPQSALESLGDQIKGLFGISPSKAKRGITVGDVESLIDAAKSVGVLNSVEAAGLKAGLSFVSQDDLDSLENQIEGLLGMSPSKAKREVTVDDLNSLIDSARSAGILTGFAAASLKAGLTYVSQDELNSLENEIKGLLGLSKREVDLD